MLEEITARRSIRKYKQDRVSKDDIIEIIKAAQFAPNGHNNRAWEFLIIEDKETKEKIFKVIGQDFVKEAPILIMPIIDLEKSMTAVEDLSIASGYIFLQAKKLGLGTVWKNIGKEAKEEIREILEIPAKYLFINVIPLGYPLEETEMHTDSDFDENKIHWGKW